MSALSGAISVVRRTQPLRVEGSVAALRGMSLDCDDLPVPVGSLVCVRCGAHAADSGRIYGEVVGFSREHAIVMLLGQAGGIRVGDRVVAEQASPTVQVGRAMLGRVINGLGVPIDQGAILRDTVPVALSPEPITPMKRRRITQALATGVRSMDLMTTLGRGQRLGIFAGPGVGKSTLLG